MSKVLVKYRMDWADEFDVHGFALVDKDYWTAEIEILKNSVGIPISYYFGTNEYFEEESGQYLEELRGSFLRSYEVQDVSDGDVLIFEKYFGNQYKGKLVYGDFPFPSEILQENIDELQ